VLIDEPEPAFFFQSYSHLAYLDYGGALFYPDPVRRPAPKVGLDGSTLAPPSADPKSAMKSHQGNCKGKRSRTRIKEITNETRYQKPAGHYSASTSSATTSAPASSASSSLSQIPPPVGPFSRRGCFARSLGPPGCTSPPPVDRPCATSASPLRCLLGPRPHRGLLVFPLVTALEEVVSRLVSTLLFSGSHH